MPPDPTDTFVEHVLGKGTRQKWRPPHPTGAEARKAGILNK